jgi:NTE family protein
MEIGLALSGGGLRAATFHLGVLRRLADEKLLGDVRQLSTVSGGSLITAALFARTGMRWPGSGEFDAIYADLRRLLTTADLFSFAALGWSGSVRKSGQLLSHRARLLADLLTARWHVVGGLRELPDSPVWWINSTCIETGKNWRFSKREMGDWQFGCHYDPPFSIAEAAAASAALPYAIGALSLLLPEEGWYRTDPATREPKARQPVRSRRVDLWDGGAYENLGLETLFKPGQGLVGCDFLICADASGPLGQPMSWPILGLLRGQLAGPRLFDVCSDQIRSLRARMLVRGFIDGTARGVLLRMGNSVRDIDMKSGRQREAHHYDRFQADDETAMALRHATDLKALSPALFDRIARHGYELADATLTAYCPAEFSRSFAWR